MRVFEVKKGEPIASRSDKVMEWYLIQKGTALQTFETVTIELEANSIIGILEQNWFICDYIAKEDTTVIAIPIKDAFDLQNLLAEHENFRPLFLRAALLQRHKELSLYASLSARCTMLHDYAEHFYSKFSEIANEFMIPQRSFTRIDNFEPIHMKHMASEWEVSFNDSLIRKHFAEYMQLMMKDDSLCVGAIMEASAQMRRVTQGIEEMENYLLYNKDIFLADNNDDLFHLIYDVASLLYQEGKDIARVQDLLEQLIKQMKKLEIYEEKQIQACENLITNYDNEVETTEYLNASEINCVEHIMKYAGYSEEEAETLRVNLQKYNEIPDKSSLDSEAFAIKKSITKTFYEVYEKAFMRSVREDKELDPILSMFFNFGYMDAEFLGEDKVAALQSLISRMGFFRSANVMPAYDWLVKIYRGEEEPSRNDLDMDFTAYLLDMKKNGQITMDEMKALQNNLEEKVLFEIRNMFTTGHRITYGRVTTFIPVLSGEEMMSSVEKMAATVERVNEAINEVRRLDYKAFFREIMFSDPEHGIPNEKINKEILPYVILMPTVGTKGMMWQETAGVRSNTNARFLLPIFSSMDINEQMIEIVARYRWEFCKHIMGVHWNDIREKSLTSEYTDYLQFYKKNHDISPETREKIKSQLSRSRNSFREVFVKDYFNWMKFESKGGFRLNKISRAIMVSYCPFSSEVRSQLSLNPAYESAFRRLNGENLKACQRLTALYDKYEKAGGEITPDLRENMKFYQM